MTSAAQELTSRERSDNLIGGLTLLPYGVLVLFSALAFAQGWLQWEPGGVPFLGLVLAALFDKLIKRYYLNKFDFTFDANPHASTPSRNKKLIGVLAVLGFLFAWFADANLHFPVRLLPLVIGIPLCSHGLVVRVRHRILGWTHVCFGILLSLSGFLPLVLNYSHDNRFFGIDGVLELSILGTAAMVIGLMEHQIILHATNVSAKQQEEAN